MGREQQIVCGVKFSWTLLISGGDKVTNSKLHKIPYVLQEISTVQPFFSYYKRQKKKPNASRLLWYKPYVAYEYVIISFIFSTFLTNTLWDGIAETDHMKAPI